MGKTRKLCIRYRPGFKMLELLTRNPSRSLFVQPHLWLAVLDWIVWYAGEWLDVLSRRLIGLPLLCRDGWQMPKWGEKNGNPH